MNPSPNISEHLRDTLAEDGVWEWVPWWGARSGGGCPAPLAQAANTGEPPGMGVITCNYLILIFSLYI